MDRQEEVWTESEVEQINYSVARQWLCTLLPSDMKTPNVGFVLYCCVFIQDVQKKNEVHEGLCSFLVGESKIAHPLHVLLTGDEKEEHKRATSRKMYENMEPAKKKKRFDRIAERAAERKGLFSTIYTNNSFTFRGDCFWFDE